jgi:hypothetical protein
MPNVTTDANTPYIDQTITSGSLTVYGQVVTNMGTSYINGDCSATVNITASTTPTPTPSVTPSVTPSATPTPTGQVLGTSTTPLPDTGPESALGGVVGLSAIGVASRAYLRSRKSLMTNMRKHRTK